MATVDGYDEGPNQEVNWPVVDQERNEFALQQGEQPEYTVDAARRPSSPFSR